MKTKKVEIEIPVGKKVEVVNGKLKLVDEEMDNRPVTERIKTFRDAAIAVGIEDPDEWEARYNDVEPDILAYFKLRIICEALNEGWEPQFSDFKMRYVPRFNLYTLGEFERMNKAERRDKKMMDIRGKYKADGYDIFASYLSVVESNSCVIRDAVKLTLKTKELAIHCGKYFINIWADYLLIRI